MLLVIVLSLVKSCWPLLRDLSCYQDQDHIHPHIYAAPTLGVCKNMLPSTKNSAPTLGVDKKICLLDKNSMFWKDSDPSLSEWFRRRDMSYAKVWKKFGHMKVQEKKIGTHEGPKILKKKKMSTWRLKKW
jgi:hypothetical protein